MAWGALGIRSLFSKIAYLPALAARYSYVTWTHTRSEEGTSFSKFSRYKYCKYCYHDVINVPSKLEEIPVTSLSGGLKKTITRINGSNMFVEWTELDSHLLSWNTSRQEEETKDVLWRDFWMDERGRNRPGGLIPNSIMMMMKNKYCSKEVNKCV
jgi:hypothetical protein